VKSAASILQAVARITGPVLILLGIILWTGRGYQLLPLHIGLGVVLVLTLWIQAVLAARSGVNRGFVAFAILWGAFMPVFGMAQANILAGPYHWVVRVLHLAVGIVAMGMIDGLGKQVQQGAAPGGAERVTA